MPLQKEQATAAPLAGTDNPREMMIRVISYGSRLSTEIYEKTQMHSDERFGCADFATQPTLQAELKLLTHPDNCRLPPHLSCTECVMDGFERHPASTLKVLVRRAIQT